MRTWSNARGEGNLFSIDLLDEDGSEIRGTFFKADADKWHESLQEGQVRACVRVCVLSLLACTYRAHQVSCVCVFVGTRFVVCV